MRACKFTFDDGPVWDGFAHGSTWNGFDNVAVTAAVRDDIGAWMLAEAIDPDAVVEEVADMRAIPPIEGSDPPLYSLGWGYATQIIHTRYIVRDVATKGCDFLVWGDDDPQAAQVSLLDARADGLDVELVIMSSDRMDDHTRRLITGEKR